MYLNIALLVPQDNWKPIFSGLVDPLCASRTCSMRHPHADARTLRKTSFHCDSHRRAARVDSSPSLRSLVCFARPTQFENKILANNKIGFFNLPSHKNTHRETAKKCDATRCQQIQFQPKEVCATNQPTNQLPTKPNSRINMSAEISKQTCLASHMRKQRAKKI